MTEIYSSATDNILDQIQHIQMNRKMSPTTKYTAQMSSVVYWHSFAADHRQEIITHVTSMAVKWHETKTPTVN